MTELPSAHIPRDLGTDRSKAPQAEHRDDITER
jgi:hypothetical protein